MEKIKFVRYPNKYWSLYVPQDLASAPFDGRKDYDVDYYRASDVSALLADVRALVEAANALVESAEDAYSHCDCYEVGLLQKRSRETGTAIATVERHLEGK